MHTFTLPIFTVEHTTGTRLHFLSDDPKCCLPKVWAAFGAFPHSSVVLPERRGKKQHVRFTVLDLKFVYSDTSLFTGSGIYSLITHSVNGSLTDSLIYLLMAH